MSSYYFFIFSESFSTFWIGILSGVVASFFFYLLSLLVKNTIIPEIRNTIYKGPDLSGEWTVFHSKKPMDEGVGECLIEQKGKKVTAQVSIWKSRRDKSQINKKFYFDGIFSSGHLIGVYEDEKLRGYATGVMVLVLSTRNTVLTGKTMYNLRRDDQVKAFNLCMKRSV